MGGKLPKKKKVPGVGVDFKKVKHKVGKKLPRAQNETNTNFTARSINLPNQSVTDDKLGAAVNQRNLTLKELLSQTTHYSDKTRKDAMIGLADLFTSHPDELRKHTGAIIEKLAERISDAEAHVRSATRALLRDKVLPGLDATALAPFLPLIMAHICSAMTHLATSIRLDALGFLEALMDHVPQQVVAHHLVPSLEHYCDLLSQAHRGRSIKAQSLASLLKVLHSLTSFLDRAFGSDGSSSGSGSGSGGAGSSSSKEARAAAGQGSSTIMSSAGQQLSSSRCAWAPAGSKQAAQASSSAPSSNTAVNAAAGKLLSGLFTCWAECNPAQLATQPEQEPAQALLLMLRCTNMLTAQLKLLPAQGTSSSSGAAGWAGVSASVQQEQQVAEQLAEVVLPRLLPHFPAYAPVVQPGAVLQEVLVQYNLQATQLLARFAMAGVSWPQQQARPGGGAGTVPARHAAFASWQQQLVDYYAGVLQQGQVLPVHESQEESARAAATATAAVQQAVLASVQAALPHLPQEARAQLLAAVSQLSDRLPLKSSVKAACLRLQHQLFRSYVLAGAGGQGWEQDQVTGWIKQAPKLLWQLGHKQPAMTQELLQLLHDAGRYSWPGSTALAALQEVQERLAPLLCTTMPSKAGKASTAVAKATVLVGPICRLSPELQHLAIDVLAFLPGLSPAVLKAAVLTCQLDCLPDSSASRLAGLLLQRGPQLLQPQELLQLLASLLAPARLQYVDLEGKELQASAGRHAALVQLVCQALCGAGHPAELLLLMEPWLLQQLQELQEEAAGGGAAASKADECYQRLQLTFIKLLEVAAAVVAGSEAAEGSRGSGLAQGLPAGVAAASAVVMADYCCQSGEAQQEQQQEQQQQDGSSMDGAAAERLELVKRVLLLAPGLLWPLLQRLQELCCSTAGTAAFELPASVICELITFAKLRAAVMEGQAQLRQLVGALAAAAGASKGVAQVSNMRRAQQLQVLAKDLYGVQ